MEKKITMNVLRSTKVKMLNLAKRYNLIEFKDNEDKILNKLLDLMQKKCNGGWGKWTRAILKRKTKNEPVLYITPFFFQAKMTFIFMALIGQEKW